MSELIAKVAVENTAYSFDEAFDYAIPDSLSDAVRAGSMVLVPFGNGNAKRQGFVFALRDAQPDKKLKKISAVLTSAPLLTNEMLRVAVYLKENTFCTLYEAAKATLPSGVGIKVVNSYVVNPDIDESKLELLSADELSIYNYLLDKSSYVLEEKILKDMGFDKDSDIVRRVCKKGFLVNSIDSFDKIKDSTVKMARLSRIFIESDDEIKLSQKQKSIVSLLEDIGSASIKEICYFTGVTSSVISTLDKKGVIEIFENKVFRSPKSSSGRTNNDDIVLTDEQNEAYKTLISKYSCDTPETALLFGVTGSGKTQIFLKLIDDVIKDGKSAIVMVPEISLTPQMLDIFYSRYGDNVAVFHSGLSMGERKDEWQRVKDGKASIILGTRSAVFAPAENLGLIVIDEEQEQTYKSEMTPRYNAKNVAQLRSKLNNCLLLLASATPSVTSYANAKSGKYTLCTLNNRYGNAVLPDVITSDMKYGADPAVRSNISAVLQDAVNENLDNKKQTILLLNRRGYNTFASCSECGHVKVCPNCSISLTYHLRNKRLMCHYCGYSEPFNDECTECGKKAVVFSGTGTQKLEDELAQKFPTARILRLDTDTTGSRYYFEDSLKKFADGEYDILLGTQMVAKGLDFPNVTLVGVISIDQQLFNDDYKSAERAFDLLTQVVGRSGRGNEKGKAIIQTAFPENEIIKLAAKQDYEAFYKLEISVRRALIYPPYCDFCSIGFVGADELMTKSASKAFFDMTKKLHKSEYSDLDLIILSPLAPRVSKIAGKYRYRVIIKCKNTKRLREFISRLLKEFANDKNYKKITAFADINPESMF
jgi:primosomal protein N' (replication factor Y)